jgi:hypothetical protein
VQLSRDNKRHTQSLIHLPLINCVTESNPLSTYLLFYLQVLALQLAVQNLAVESSKLNRTVRLNDICFKPLSPDNNNCTIMSVLNYFQNSHDRLDAVRMDEYGFDEAADYLTHFSICSR